MIKEERFQDLPSAEQRMIFRNVFATPDGVKALDHLLWLTGWTHELNAQPTALSVGVEITRLLGYYDPNNRDLILRQIVGLDNQTYPRLKEMKESESIDAVGDETPDRGEQP